MHNTEHRSGPKIGRRLTASSRLKLSYAAEMIIMGAPATDVSAICRVSLPQVRLWMKEQGLVENVRDNEYTLMIARLAGAAEARGR